MLEEGAGGGGWGRNPSPTVLSRIAFGVVRAH